MSFVWNSLDLPYRARRLFPAAGRGTACRALTASLRHGIAAPQSSPRTQDARGSLMLPTCCPLLSAVRTPEAPQGLPRAQGGLQPARATSRPRRRASPWKLEEHTDRHGCDESARMLMSFVWNSLDLPYRARRLFPAAGRGTACRALTASLRHGIAAPQSSPRRRASPCLAEGQKPRRGFHALREGFSPHAQRRARAGGLRLAWPTSSAPIGYQLSPIGYQLLSAITYRLSAITYRLSAIIYRLSAIIYRLSAITYRLSAITYRLSAITYRLSPIGYHLSPI
jgi:hypothetical protein